MKPKKTSLHNRGFAALLFVFIVALSYSNSFHASFQFDDYDFIQRNYSIRDIRNLSGMWHFLSQPSRFVCFLTFALNYKLHRFDVFGYHLFNFLIHIGTAFNLVLLFDKLIYLESKIAKKENQEDGQRLAQNRFLIAFFSAWLFAVHPVQTQAVTYITQRFASLATLFYVSALNVYLKARTSPQSREQVLFLLLFFILAVLGMLTKEIVITIPLMVWLLEKMFIIPYRLVRQWSAFGSFQTAGRFLTPLLLLLCLVPALYSFNVFNVFLVPKTSSSHLGDILTLDKYILTQGRVFMTFLRLFIYPVRQNLDYDYPMSPGIFDPDTFMSWVGLLIFIGLAFKFVKSNRLIAFGLFWFLVTFLPNFVPRRHVIFEHKLYLLSIGLCLSFTLSLFYWSKNKKIFIILILSLVLCLAQMTFMRNKVWENEITLWTDVVRKSPQKARPYMNLGKAYLKKGDDATAFIHLSKALELYPDFYKALINRSVIYAKRKQYAAAFQDLNKAIRLKSNNSSAYNNRGVLFYKIKKYDISLKDFNTAIRLNPQDHEIYYNRGMLFQTTGQNEKALADYSRAITLNPYYAQAYNNRGNVLRALMKDDLALKDYNQSIKLDEKNAEAYNNRGNFLHEKKLYLSALKDFEMAVEVDQSFDKAYYNKGNLFLEMEQADRAIESYTKAVQVNPNYVKAYVNRGSAFFKKGDYDQAMKDFSMAVRLDNQYAPAYYNRSVAHQRKGNIRAALDDALLAQKYGYPVNDNYLQELKRKIKP